MPAEHQTPLIVDAYGMEPLPTTLERFQSVPRRDPKITQLGGIVQIEDLAARHTMQLRRERPRLLRATVEKQVFSKPVSEGGDHGFYVIVTR